MGQGRDAGRERPAGISKEAPAGDPRPPAEPGNALQARPQAYILRPRQRQIGATRLDFLTWSEENPQASAGAHNARKRLIIIYDEAVGIHDEIWKTQEGAFTDAETEIIMIAFSQCTRSSGMFFEATHGSQRNRWHSEVIDSRTVEASTSRKFRSRLRFTELTPIRYE